ncbi:MAG: ABC transporter substrate-binding protein [Gammaproteobacteria bacterium]|nr:ABC transporter substrate-binding protein [Gammaproteobacteria bacterium]
MKQFIGLLLILSILLSACSAQKIPVLRIGTNVWLGYEPLYMARDKKYFQDDQVRLVEYASASQVINAFRNDLIDAAALTLDEAFLLLESDEKCSIALVMDMSYGGDALVAQKEFSSIQDIKGKKIGVESSALGAYMLTRVLEISNIKKSDVTIVNTSVDDHENQFIQKKLDAVITFEPILSKLIHAGGKLLFDSTQIPGEIVDVLIIKDEYLKKYPQQLELLKAAWFKTLKEIKTQPEASAKILSQRMNLSTKQTLAAYNGILLPNKKENEHLLYNNKNPILLYSSKRLAKIMEDEGLISKTLKPELLFSATKKLN